MKKRRADSFFGLHFDFHATPAGVAGRKIGEKLRREDIDEICKLIRPDYLQIDCKGHPGYSSYPTKVGTPAGECCGDPLRLWRETTAENDVALYMHYSGIWDTCYARSHPECVKIRCDGTPDEHIFTSVFSDYVDKLMIPQIYELIGYGVDGIWVDGDCWAAELEHGQRALDAFYDKTGVRLTEDDLHIGMPYYDRYREFCREAFLDYVARYTNAAHDKCPEFQVTSNWLFTEQLPRRVSVPLDYLSGDYSPNDSFDGASFSGRIMAAQGKPWDLMAWTFRRRVDRQKKIISSSRKHPVQLMQEAAAIIALGGGFQAYICQDQIGTPDMDYIRKMKPVAEFCRAREEYCFRNEIIPNVVIFNSSYDHGVSLPEEALFGCHDYYYSIRGWCKLLGDAGHSYEIRSEHNLFDRIDRYPVVVCPQICTEYTDEDVAVLKKYAENGGNLVLGGDKTISRFALDGIVLTPNSDSPLAHFMFDDEDDQCGCASYSVNVGEEWATVGGGKFATVIPFGKGRIVLIGGDIGGGYYRFRTIAGRKLAEKLFGLYTPTARVTDTHCVNVVSTRRDGITYIQLISTLGAHNSDSVNSFDEIVPQYGVKLDLNLGFEPEKLILRPSGENLKIEKHGDTVSTVVPKIGIHEIIEVR